MKTDRRQRSIALAVALALMMHLLLFIVVRPANGTRLRGMPLSPETCYMGKPASRVLQDEIDARRLWSPVLFSLPAEMGFSHDLFNDNLRIRLTFSQRRKAERFLDIDPANRAARAQLQPEKLMLTQGLDPAPNLPPSDLQPVEKRVAQRVYMPPELKDRLIGGVVLPAELNQPATTPWQVRANLRISQYGTVQHVFLDKPLDSEPLNTQLLQVLHGLRFKPAESPVETSMEIYSPDAGPNGGGVK